jgi:hypothetical protein
MAQRLVILTGEVYVRAFDAQDYQAAIGDALSRQGFNVANLVLSSFYLSFGYAIKIEIYVDAAYTAEQARQSALQTIGGVSGITSVNLSILSDNAPATTNTDSTTQDALTQNLESLLKSAVTNTTGNVGFPIGIAVVVVGAIFLLRRR